MQRSIVIVSVLLTFFAAGAFAQKSAQCSAPPDKNGEVKCTRSASFGYYLDIIPNRPRVKFTYHVYRNGIRIYNQVYELPYLGGDMPYRFNAGSSNSGSFHFETWLVECSDHNGIKARCSDLLVVKPVDK